MGVCVLQEMDRDIKWAGAILGIIVFLAIIISAIGYGIYKIIF